MKLFKDLKERTRSRSQAGRTLGQHQQQDFQNVAEKTHKSSAQVSHDLFETC